MVQCAIDGCSSRSDTQASGLQENGIHFHRLPRASLIRQKWMDAINRHEVKASTRVCSLHFKQENYYLTKQGFHKLTGGSIPELKLPVFRVRKDSSSDEEMTNVPPPKQNISCQSQSPKTDTKEVTPENGTTDNVSGLSNIKHAQVINDDTTDSSSDDDEMSNVQPQEQNISYQSQCQLSSTKEITSDIETTVTVLGSTSMKHAEEDSSDTTDSSGDENMSNVQPQGQSNINLANQCQKNNSNEMTTDQGSSSTKPGLQKHKLKVNTQLERKLLKEVRRLREQGKTRMQAISCLLEQNRRLLERNSFLEKALDNSKKSGRNVNK